MSLPSKKPVNYLNNKDILKEIHESKSTYCYFTKPELFYKTKFSVVVETEAEYNEYHITEKTLKCLVMGHPFVVMGTPGYLNFLHSIGFMTFY